MTSNNTPDPLTEQQLADIETRANAATPGPWCTDSWEIYQGTEYEPGISMWIGETCRGTTSPEQDSSDAEFVAAARTDVPALLAEVRRLRAESERRTEDLAAADNPTPLRWGLNDVLWGDDDTVTVLLSGPGGEPYWLELDLERAAVLRQDLAGPPAEEQPAVDASEACGKCKQPFDPADTRFDGQARHYLTPYCCGCVDRCHDNESADHRCVICA